MHLWRCRGFIFVHVSGEQLLCSSICLCCIRSDRIFFYLYKFKAA